MSVMGAFLAYILQSTGYLTLFYLFYKVLMSCDTFHRLNRLALLGLMGLAATLPWVATLWGGNADAPLSDAPVDFALSVASAGTARHWSWERALVMIYPIGLCVAFAHFVYSLYSLLRIVKTGTRERVEGVRLRLTDRPVVPFSWMRTIVMSRADYQENGREILAHERAHIEAFHSWDLLFARIYVLFHWFNPAAWLLLGELRDVHEYEADERVLRQGFDAHDYQLLIIKRAAGSQRFTSMANSFNHSSLKKRITMMLRQMSNPWARLKYLGVLPLAALAATAFAHPEIARELERISSAKVSDIFVTTDTIATESDGRTSRAVSPEEEEPFAGFQGIIYIDGLEVSLERANRLDPDRIECVTVFKGEMAVARYGERGKKGVIEITTQK